MLREFYPGRMLPDFYGERRGNRVFAVSMMLCMVIAYAGILSFDELVGLSLLAAAFSMLLGYRREIHLRPWHYVVFALSIVLLIGGIANSRFGYGRGYIYYFLEGVFIFDEPVAHIPGSYGLGVAICYAAIWWLTIAMSGRRYTEGEIRTFQNYYMNFITFLSIVLVSSNMTWNWITGPRRGMVHFFIWELNANALVYFAIPVITVCLARILVKWDWQSFLMILVNICMLMICGSRGAYLALMIAVVALYIYFCCIAPYRKKLILFGGVALCVLAVLFVALWAAVPEKMEHFFMRVFRLENLTTGRSGMWADALSHMKTLRDWLWGMGWTEYYLYDFYPVSHVGLHNMYMEYLYSGGIFAALLVFAVWVMFFVKTHDWFVVALMAAPIVHTLVENGDIPVGFTIMILTMSLTEQRKENPQKNRYMLYYFLDRKQQAVFDSWVSPSDSGFAVFTAVH